jgi:hypothetical protein
MSQDTVNILIGFIEERGFNVRVIFKKHRTVMTVSAPHFEVRKDDFVCYIIVHGDTDIQVTHRGMAYNAWAYLDLHDPNSLHQLEDMMDKAAIL